LLAHRVAARCRPHCSSVAHEVSEHSRRE
jgi:hypothetical protein